MFTLVLGTVLSIARSIDVKLVLVFRSRSMFTRHYAISSDTTESSHLPSTMRCWTSHSNIRSFWRSSLLSVRGKLAYTWSNLQFGFEGSAEVFFLNNLYKLYLSKEFFLPESLNIFSHTVSLLNPSVLNTIVNFKSFSKIGVQTPFCVNFFVYNLYKLLCFWRILPSLVS